MTRAHFVCCWFVCLFVCSDEGPLSLDHMERLRHLNVALPGHFIMCNWIFLIKMI